MARPTRSAKRKRPDVLHPAPQIPLRHSDPPLSKQHAAAILDVLSIVDSQGLLDRVFPVHAHPTRSSPLRALLAEQQPLSVLRAAIHHLQPISALPRAHLSPTAAQQHRFCSLATDLLNQASAASAPLLDDFLPASPSNKPRSLRYALLQHLPNQEYWSSLNSPSHVSLTSLPTAHAELVAVLPTPSSQSDKYPVPTLASYASAPISQSIKPLPQQRTVTTGAFLDFGPWASFAPTFDHDGEVVGRNELALTLYASRPIKRTRECESIQEPPPIQLAGPASVDLEDELRELFPPEDAAAVKSALDTLHLENAVQELLDRNRRALLRLEHLQHERIINDDAPVEQGSEEWDTAQGILETLTVLASLRPRSTTAKSIIPPPSILHRLHRTLAVSPSPGWHGTLPDSRPGALSDDTTFKKSSRAVPPPTPTPTATNPAAASTAAPVTVTAPVALPYSGYTYAYGQQGQTQPYRPASTGAPPAPTNGYTQYASQYYAYTPQQQGQQQNYYTGQQQGYTAASYSTWYNNLYSAQQASGSASGKSTPQPQAAGSYGSFFGTAPARTPAVANTVYASTTPRTQTGGQQGGYYGYNNNQAAPK